MLYGLVLLPTDIAVCTGFSTIAAQLSSPQAGLTGHQISASIFLTIASSATCAVIPIVSSHIWIESPFCSFVTSFLRFFVALGFCLSLKKKKNWSRNSVALQLFSTFCLQFFQIFFNFFSTFCLIFFLQVFLLF